MITRWETWTSRFGWLMTLKCRTERSLLLATSGRFRVYSDISSGLLSSAFFHLPLSDINFRLRAHIWSKFLNLKNKILLSHTVKIHVKLNVWLTADEWLTCITCCVLWRFLRSLNCNLNFTVIVNSHSPDENTREIFKVKYIAFDQWLTYITCYVSHQRLFV